jgi:hypothetical protein
MAISGTLLAITFYVAGFKRGGASPSQFRATPYEIQ